MSEPERASEQPADDVDEGELIRASARGDQDAFGRLMERYRRLVLHVAYRSMGDMSLAEDVAQEAFIKVFRGLPNYRPEKPFIHWLRRVVGNTVVDELRRRRPVVSLDGMQQPPPSDADDPQDVTDQHGIQQAVREAIAALPPRYREIITLHAFHELTYEEIAQALTLPLGTVMWRLNMAKRLLRKRLRSTAEEAESA